MITIKKLPPERWQDYRDIRLESLKNEPLAFGSSYEEELNFSSDLWKERISNVMFALDGEKVVGTMVYVFESKNKLKHIANIFGVYVKKDYRGKGIADLLIKRVLKVIEENKNISKIKLTVNPEQAAALRFYEKYGFKSAGTLKNELKINDKYYDEIMMEKII